MQLTDIDLNKIKELSREYKKRVVANAELLRSHIKAIENEVLAEMRKGSLEYSQSLKLVRTSPRRKLKSDTLDKDMSPLLDYLPPEALAKEVPITLTELEKLLKAKLGSEEAKKVLSEVVTKPEGVLVAVPLSDKREAVDLSTQLRSVEDEFEGF
jgi:hypothetical protein